jgi:hypothetical protein
LIITDALMYAETKYVVYFLLTSYMEALDHLDRPRSSLPSEVTRLPVTGKGDLNERVATLSMTIDAIPPGSPIVAMAHEVLDVFRAAEQRLGELPHGETRSDWNVVERSQQGHERRRRLDWRMSDREAAEWAQKNGTQLERVSRPTA